jgi:hypothetical protein
MMENFAQVGEGWGACPSPFTLVTIMYKVAVYAPAKRADALPLFQLYPFVLCGCTQLYKGRILGRNWDKSLRNFMYRRPTLYTLQIAVDFLKSL